MKYNEESGTVIYRSRMHAKTKRNYEMFSAEDLIAAITQHIPEKGFQMVRYYGWYSNRARGERAKQQTEEPETDTPANIQIIDVSDYQPRRLPSKKWRELIKQVWEVDPFDCPRCGSEMKLIALIDDNEVIDLPAMLRIALQAGKILRHLNLWPQEAIPARSPPKLPTQDYILEPFFSATGGSACGGDGYSDYDLPAMSAT